MILLVFIIFSVVNSFSFPKNLISNLISYSTRSKHQLYLSASDGYSLGAPRIRPNDGKYTTKENILVEYQVEDVEDVKLEVNNLIDLLDDHNGEKFLCSYSFLTYTQLYLTL